MKLKSAGVRLATRIVLGASTLFILAALCIVVDGLTDEVQSADVAVVLGNTVESNGQPSARLQARLDKAAELFRRDLFPNIIISGGLGAEGFDEAVVMKRYLVEQGIPSDRILVDSQGLTTRHTAANSTRLMENKNWASALVISQYFHISRTRLAFERFGIEPVYAAHADFFELRDFYSTAREIIGYGVYLFRLPSTKP